MADPRECQGESQPGSSSGPSPTALAIAMLSRREHSRVQLIRKLAAKGIESACAAEVAQDLADRGYQSDARFADMLARTRIADGCGPLRIRADLRFAGVDDCLAAPAMEGALDYLATGWLEVARAALRRRGLSPASNLVAGRRAFALLQRRGFEGDTIRAAIRGTGADS